MTKKYRLVFETDKFGKIMWIADSTTAVFDEKEALVFDYDTAALDYKERYGLWYFDLETIVVDKDSIKP